MRAVVQEIVKQLLRKPFVVWERLGIHVTPDNFESPIPDTRCLNEEIWSKRSNLTGIDMREREQIKLLETFVDFYKDDYERFPRSKTGCSHQYYLDNGFFEAVDGRSAVLVASPYAHLEATPQSVPGSSDDLWHQE